MVLRTKTMRALIFLLAIAIAVVWVRSLFRPRPAFRSEPADEPAEASDSPEIFFDGSEELTTLLSSPDLVSIDAYRGALHGVGIPTVVYDEDTSRMLGTISAVTTRIMVPVSRLEEARALIDDFEPGTFSDPDEK